MERRRTRRLPVVAGTMLLVAGFGVAAGVSTRAAYSDDTNTTGNQFAAGSVTVADNDAGDVMLSLTDARPGDTTQACIKVTYSGSLPASVRMYGTTSGTGLAQYLSLRITRGTFTSPEPQFASCTNFTADATNYIGQGAGVVYNGTLAAYPDAYADGIVDPLAASPEEWTGPESHVYRVTVTLLDDSAAEGKTATQAFTWEARNN